MVFFLVIRTLEFNFHAALEEMGHIFLYRLMWFLSFLKITVNLSRFLLVHACFDSLACHTRSSEGDWFSPEILQTLNKTMMLYFAKSILVFRKRNLQQLHDCFFNSQIVL
jgi:hypothetical protein